MSAAPVDVLAFYLPQFHRIPENDRWWGEGFTEWTNVDRAVPTFRGHNQPRVPTELGHYDLTDVSVLRRQAALAVEHGVGAFAFYHYWFNGRRLLEQPVERFLATPDVDIAFCLVWANENWTRRWDGQEHEVLMRAEYSEADDEAHFEALLPALRDPRAYRIDGRPLLAVYKASLHPDPAGLAATWRRLAASAGLPGLHLARVEADERQLEDPRSLGFDSAIEFQPRWGDLPGESAWRRVRRRVGGQRGALRHRVIEYDALVERMTGLPAPAWTRWPCVTPDWDNSPRRRRDGVVLHRSSPASFQRWVEHAVTSSPVGADGRKRVFVNAWNEWGEGAYLEPDQRHGRGYLRALRAAVGLADGDKER